MPEKLRLNEQEIAFYKPLVALYLKYGSVDKVFAEYYHNTGVSYPHFHRILHEWGIMKSTGPHSRFAEAIFFLTELAKDKLPLETLYRTMPPSLQISAATLHRILSYVKRGLTRRHATALIVSPQGNPDLALIGRDISTPRPEIGKPFGAFSLPMTYSKAEESEHDAILRVLQQEVAANLALERKLPGSLIPINPKLLLTIDIADVRVRTFRVIVPDELLQRLNSFKLEDMTFIPLSDVASSIDLDSHYRAGVPEIAQGLLEMGESLAQTPPHFGSLLNQKLAALPAFA